MHPLRKSSSSALIVDISQVSDLRKKHDEGIEESISFIGSISETLDKLKNKIDMQNSLISSLEKVVRDLEMHKEAAYGEMAKTETALRVERERADRFEHLYSQSMQQDQSHQERVNRLMTTVRDAFDRAQNATT